MRERAARRKMTGTDEGYACLRGAILRGELLPNERLVELDLAERFTLGRAAIRSALARLEQDGMVVREPFRGARVRAISEADAVEILEARAVLEGLAVRYAALKAGDGDLEALRAVLGQMAQRYDEGDLLGISDLNSRLHRELLRISGHATATRLIEGLQAQNVRYQFRTILVPGRAARSLDEHRAIVDAVAARDPEAAEAAMRAHLSQVTRSLRQASATPGAALLP